MHLEMLPLDYVEFFVFLAALVVVGVWSGRGERDNSVDYFLAGRRLPWYAVGGSYVAANVSTEHFIGLVGASYILGMPPALAQWQTTIAEVVIVFLFVPFLIRAKVTTVPEYLAQRFGPGVRLAFALLTIFANITIFMAAVMYAGGLALSGFFGWPLLACIIGTGLFAGAFAIYCGVDTGGRGGGVGERPRGAESSPVKKGCWAKLSAPMTSGGGGWIPARRT